MTGSALVPTLRMGGLFVILGLLTLGPNAEATLTAWCGTTNGSYELVNCDFSAVGKHDYPTLSWTENANGSGLYGIEIYVQYTGSALPIDSLRIGLDKTVVNQTGVAWTGMDMELSNLSTMLAWDMTHQPIDTLGNFSLTAYTDQGLWWDGWLSNGDSVGLWAAVTVPVAWNAQYSRWEGHFYLEQIPKSVPEPATLGLLGAGLIGLAWRRRAEWKSA